MFSPARSHNRLIRSQVWSMAARVVLLSLAGLLASCIDGREEYWITGNGSGRAEVEYSMPSSIANMEGGEKRIRKALEDFFKETPAIQNGKCNVVTANGRTRVCLKFDFHSGIELAEVSGSPAIGRLPSAVEHLVGEVKTRIDGRTMQCTRTTTPDKAIPAVSLMPHSQFEGSKLVYIIHLPAAAQQSNATRVTDDGRTLIWETPLKDTVNHPLVMRFQMVLPLPWGSILGAIGILLTGIVFGTRWLMKRRKIKHCRPCDAEK